MTPTGAPWPAAPVPATWSTTTQTPGPAEPELQEGVDPDSVTPGVLGFAVTLAAVLACIPLFWSMTRKIRGVQHRGRLEEAAAAAARPAPAPGAAPLAGPTAGAGPEGREPLPTDRTPPGDGPQPGPHGRAEGGSAP